MNIEWLVECGELFGKFKNLVALSKFCSLASCSKCTALAAGGQRHFDMPYSSMPYALCLLVYALCYLVSRNDAEAQREFALCPLHYALCLFSTFVS